MTERCAHVATVDLEHLDDIVPSSEGCEDCLRIGGRWVHLRLCLAAATWAAATTRPTSTPRPTGTPRDHPLIRSYEPGEDWWWCYADDLFFEIDGAPPSPSHP